MRSLSLCTSAAALLLLLGHGADAAPRKTLNTRYTVNQQRANTVKEAFQTSWDGYYKYAFPHDSLRPMSHGFADDRWVLALYISG